MCILMARLLLGEFGVWGVIFEGRLLLGQQPRLGCRDMLCLSLALPRPGMPAVSSGFIGGLQL